MSHSEGSPYPDKSRMLPAHPEVLEEDELDLFDYIEVIIRRRWLIFCGTVICMLASLLYVTPQPELYRAETTILPEEIHNFLNIDKGRSGRKQSSYIDILESTSLNRRVVQNEYHYTLDGEKYNTNLLAYFGVKTLHRSIDALLEAAEFSSRGDIILIAVETRSPGLSAAIANEYATQLIAYRREKHQAQIREQLAFIDLRLSEVQSELALAEEGLAKFRRRNRNLAKGGEAAAFLMPEQASEYSRLQREVQIRSSILLTILDQYEVARLEAKKEIPNIEVLSRAVPPEFSSSEGIKKTIWLSSAVGLLVSVFLAFFIEYIERIRQSGRLEPALNEMRKDVELVRLLLRRN